VRERDDGAARQRCHDIGVEGHSVDRHAYSTALAFHPAGLPAPGPVKPHPVGVTPGHHGQGHAPAVPNPTAEFFDGLARRRHEPLLERSNTLLRFDLNQGDEREQWTLIIRRGDLAVAEGDIDPQRQPEMRGFGDPDCVITTSRDTFDRIAEGRTKPLAAWLRNQIAVEGRLQPLIMLERLLPGPPGAHDPRAIVATRLAQDRRPKPPGRSGPTR
jgi:hypothetical protein